MALLPYGLRATMSASTWVDNTAQNLKQRLFFASAPRAADRLADGRPTAADRLTDWNSNAATKQAVKPNISTAAPNNKTVALPMNTGVRRDPFRSSRQRSRAQAFGHRLGNGKEGRAMPVPRIVTIGFAGE